MQRKLNGKRHMAEICVFLLIFFIYKKIRLYTSLDVETSSCLHAKVRATISKKASALGYMYVNLIQQAHAEFEVWYQARPVPEYLF